MRSIFVIGSILFFSILTFGQKPGGVAGYVYHNGQIVTGATVTLYSSPAKQFTVKTDERGFYRFENIPSGNYELTARASNDLWGTEIVHITQGKELKQDLHFGKYPMSGAMPPIRETVTVSVDQPQPINEVSKAVNVIDGQEMRDRADFSLVDSLRSIPGFRVQQLGGFGKTASIKTRGLRNQDTAVLIDGIRFRDATSITGDATPFLSDFTLTSVSRIEVLRGSGSSVYGTNAIGGVVDFQTPEAPRGTHGQISGTFGGLGLRRFRGTVTRGSGNDKFEITAGASRTVYTRGIDGNDDANNSNLQARIDSNPLTNIKLSARFFISDAFVRLNSNPDTVGTLATTNAVIITAQPDVNFTPDADDPDDIQKSRFFSGQFVANWVNYSGKLSVGGYYQGLVSRRKNLTGPLGVGFQSNSTNIFQGTIHTANAHLVWTHDEGKYFTAGYEFEHERFSNDSASQFSADLSTLANQLSNTFYAQELAGFFQGRLQLAAGLRIQAFHLSQPRFSSMSPLQCVALEQPPTAFTLDGAASYYFRSVKTKIRAHVGNGYRIPSLYERFSSFFGAFHPERLFLAGAPDLEPERSISADGGIEKYYMSDRVRFAATYFYTKLDRAIGYGFLPQPDRFGRINSETFGGYLNTKGFISRGAEFSGKFNPTKSTDIFTSYTFTNSDQREPQVAGSGVIESLGIPNHQFTLVATQRMKQFWISFDLLVASNYLAPVFSGTTFNSYVYRFRGNRRGDVTAGYTFKLGGGYRSLRVFGTVENLFGDEYFENGFRTPDRNARLGINFGF